MGTDPADRTPESESVSSEDWLIERVARAPAVAPDENLGRVLSGRYRIRKLLGQGGMGRVYEAEDAELGRSVAVKLVRRPAGENSDALARFARERLLTAELEHPAIVPIYDSGVVGGGEPFYVMRIVRGESLDRLLARTSPSGRLGLLPNVISVAEAIAFAHSRGVIHRDLKPSNIMVGRFGETYVTDWGLAKRISSPEETSSDLTTSPDSTSRATRGGAVLGTPAYMAPEQRSGGDVDERADVYALGATLFHIVLGRPPDPQARAEPRPGPSGDLMSIVDKAIATEPAARYQKVSELVVELRRYQTGQLLDARTYTRWQLFLHWARRHRAELSVASISAVAFVVIIVSSMIRIVGEQRLAEARSADAEAARADATRYNNELILLTARAELTRDPTASLAWLKRYPEMAGNRRDAADIAIDAQARGVAQQVWDLGEPVGSVAFAPDGRTVAAGTTGGKVALLGVEGQPRRVLHAEDGVGSRVVFSPDGSELATSDSTGVVRIWKVGTGTSRRLTGDHVGGPYLVFSSDGTLLLTRRIVGGVHLWRPSTGDEIPLPAEAQDMSVLVPGGHHLAVARGSELSILDLDTGARIASATVNARVQALEVTGDGAYVVASLGESLVVWAPSSGELRRIAVPTRDLRMLVTSANGRFVVACGSYEDVDLWLFDLERNSGREFSRDERCTRQAFQFSPTADQFISAGFSTEVRLHDVDEGKTMHLLGHEGVNDAAFAPDGAAIASAGSDHMVRLWRLGQGQVRVLHRFRALDRIAATGALLGTDPTSGEVWVIDTSSGRRRRLAGPRAMDVRDRGAMSADGRVAVYPADGKLVVWDLSTGTSRTLPMDPNHNAGAEALSPDGSALLEADVRGGIELLDLSTGAARELAHLDDVGFTVAWSFDGHRVAAGGRDGTARVYDVETGKEQGRASALGWVWLVGFSRDGKQLAIASTDGIPRVLQIEGADGHVQELRGHVGSALGVDFSADGTQLYSSGADGTVRLWDLDTGHGRIIRREPAPIDFVSLSGDGTRLLGRSFNKIIIWDAGSSLPLDGEPGALKHWLTTETSAEVDRSGHLSSP